MLVTFFALGRATPLIHKSPKWKSALVTIEDAAMFQSNIETVTDIYRGTENHHGLKDMNHLVMVAGHAILLDKSNYLDDSAWVLESFQRGGQVQTFVDHILKGIEVAQKDNQSILIFSGYAPIVIEVTLGAKRARWPDPEVRDSRIGIWHIIFIAMIAVWINSCWNVYTRRNLRGIHTRICCSRYVDFLKSQEDIPTRSPSLDLGSKKNDSRISIERQCDFQRTSKTSPAHALILGLHTSELIQRTQILRSYFDWRMRMRLFILRMIHMHVHRRY